MALILTFVIYIYNLYMRAAENREGWQKIMTKSTAPLRHPNAMG